jgi:hypothetical protein
MNFKQFKEAKKIEKEELAENYKPTVYVDMDGFEKYKLDSFTQLMETFRDYKD